MTHAAARHITPYGSAASSWRLDDGAIAVEVEIPANASAMVYLPGVDQAPVAIGSGRYRWSYAYAPPEAVTPALSLDSTWGDVIDHPMAYEQVVQLFLAHNPEFVARMEGQTAITLRQAIQQNPNAQALQERVEQALIDAGT